MPAATHEIEFRASPAAVMDVLVDFERYPEFIPEMRSVRVVRSEDEIWEVAFTLELIRRVQYTLRLERDGASALRWSMVEGIFRANDGRWHLEPTDDGATRARYEIDLDAGLFLPGSLVQTLVTRMLPDMLERFKGRIEDSGSAAE
jgi:ribosome-associated toxin RatA of RatAB toxin-antitoxin module